MIDSAMNVYQSAKKPGEPCTSSFGLQNMCEALGEVDLSLRFTGYNFTTNKAIRGKKCLKV